MSHHKFRLQTCLYKTFIRRIIGKLQVFTVLLGEKLDMKTIYRPVLLLKGTEKQLGFITDCTLNSKPLSGFDSYFFLNAL